MASMNKGLFFQWLLLICCMFASGVSESGSDERSPKCKACQRLILKMDEHLITAILDLQAVQPSRSAVYGRFESTIEDIVSEGCKATSIHLERPVRRACEKFLEEFEESVVATYFAWSQQPATEDEWNFNHKICFELTGACPREYGELELEDVEALEFAATQPDGAPRASSGDAKYRSEPTPPEPRAPGTVRRVVASTFAEEVITDIEEDALVFYTFPGAMGDFHSAMVDRWQAVAGLLRGAPLVVCLLDAEKNEVPHPFGSHVKGPSVILYPSKKKYTPALMQSAPQHDDPDLAPSLADVLAFVYRRAGREETRDAAGKATMESEYSALYELPRGSHAAADEL